MHDRQLYRQILGIASPWFVEKVELRLEEGEVHVYLEHDSRADWSCPSVGRRVRSTITTKNAIYFHCGQLDLLPRPT